MKSAQSYLFRSQDWYIPILYCFLKILSTSLISPKTKAKDMKCNNPPEKCLQLPLSLQRNGIKADDPFQTSRVQTHEGRFGLRRP